MVSCGAAIISEWKRQAGAEAAQARLNLFYTHSDAPAGGFVSRQAVEPGAFVGAGQSLMATVPKTLRMTADFKETQPTRMCPHRPLEIKANPGGQ